MRAEAGMAVFAAFAAEWAMEPAGVAPEEFAAGLAAMAVANCFAVAEGFQ